MRQIITVADRMQSGYTYELVSPMGTDFDPAFQPELSPKEMLSLGVFGGKYLTDCQNEFPSDWFTSAKLSPARANPHLNYFNVTASQSLQTWRDKGWISTEDPRGWFQWYCRYYLGRRIPSLDQIQIKRWKAMRRHVAQIQLNCLTSDSSCRPKQRQALLQWAYDSRKL